MRRVHEEANVIDMNVYFAKGPFAILVDKAFPQQHSFSFGDSSQQLTAQGYPIESDDDSKATRTAMLVVDRDIAVSCEYWIEEAHGGPESHVESIMLQTDRKGVWDLNVDGIFDQQLVTDAESGKHSEQIWYDGQWQQVLPHGDVPRYERELPEVGLVTFDKESGRWTSATDKQNKLTDKEQGTTPDRSR
jgi:hypothetical protein